MIGDEELQNIFSYQSLSADKIWKVIKQSQSFFKKMGAYLRS
jgi:hypothetical protein